ncbi:MAG: hypothetical protein VYA34_04555 [Myxococcota bacterium]|nr:hypothetical protein [Myxococcota bacterium]
MKKLSKPEKSNLLLWDPDQQRRRCLEVLLRLNNFCVFPANTLSQSVELAFMACPNIFLLHVNALENHHHHEVQSFLNTIKAPTILMGPESSSSLVKKLTHPHLSKVQLPATITEIIIAIQDTEPSNHPGQKPNIQEIAQTISTENIRDDPWEWGNRWPTLSELDNINPRKMGEKIEKKDPPIKNSSGWADKILSRFQKSRPEIKPIGSRQSLNSQERTP